MLEVSTYVIYRTLKKYRRFVDIRMRFSHRTVRVVARFLKKTFFPTRLCYERKCAMTAGYNE